MRSKTIQWLASVGLGFLLGFVAARTDISSLSGAEFLAETGADPSASCNESGGNPSCCSAPTTKDSPQAPVLDSPEAPIDPTPASAPAPVESPVVESNIVSPPSD